MAATLQKFRGALALVGPTIDQLAEAALISQDAQNIQISPTDSAYHVTLVTKDELRNLSLDQNRQIISTAPDIHHIFSAGVGGKANVGVFWVVIIWAAGQQLRKQFGLPAKDFHITLSGKDIHDIDKGITTILPGQISSSPSAEFLDHIIFTLCQLGQYHEAQNYSVRLILSEPTSHKGFIRMGDASLLVDSTKLAMLAYACAYERTSEEKIKSYCTKKLVECSKATEWGPLFQDHEIAQLDGVGPVSDLLLKEWSPNLREHVSDLDLSPGLSMESRQCLLVPSPSKTVGAAAFYKLPRFFRWLIPYHLAIMSTPRNEDDVKALAAPYLGIRHVLTLTEEEPLHESWFRNKAIKNTFLPIPNYQPPSIEQMDIIMRLFDDSKNLPLLVHCGGGKGRAGTVAACYLAAFGFKKPVATQDHPELSASDAIGRLRSLRPGSLETTQQEAFVSKWCSTIWKRQSIYPELPSEPPPTPMSVEGTLGEKNDLFVLVGFPGSGKSWFTKSLIARDPSRWHCISQDESGSRGVCESEIGRAPQSKRVILDRCNTAATDRKLWLELAANWCASPVCIHFDYDQDLCISRAQMRAGHPTLPPGSRVRNAVEQMQRVYVKPILKEGFHAIITIRSLGAAQEAILRLSTPLVIYKFPRTPHLLDLGAATPDDVHLDTPAFAETGGHVVITEKIDGANMGFSLSSDRSRIVVQNRSHYVNSTTHEQFKKLGFWVERHDEELRNLLDRDPYFPERYILYGEWMYATHSIPYTRLPDYFIAYDLFDRSTKTWVDTKSLHGLLRETSISAVPILYEGKLPTDGELRNMIQKQSTFYDGKLEGVYVKVEVGSIVKSRGKVVRSDFIAGNEHWTRGGLRVNNLLLDSA